jgi:hypothetical protein
MGLPQGELSSAWQEPTVAEKIPTFARDSSKTARLSQLGVLILV